MRPLFDFSAYIADHTRDFVGREWVFAELDAWLSDPDAPRFFIITGEPGIGKTAIAARLTQVREFDAYHFCIARQADTIDPLNFARFLSHQLTRIGDFAQNLLEEQGPQVDVTINVRENYGQIIGVQIENLIVETPSAAIAFNRIVLDPLRRLYTGRFDRLLLILVDAMDEAVQQRGPETIVDLLANACRLPPQVRFVLTSRPEGATLRHFEQLNIPHLILDAGGAKNQADVQAYVRYRLDHSETLRVRLAEEEIEVLTFIKRVVEASWGNFLYLAWVLRSLEQGTQRVDLLEALPEGLDGIYREFLRTRALGEDIRTWREHYRPLLGVLAVAQEPLTVMQLASFTGMCQQRVRDLLLDMRQFLTVTSGEENQYQLYHQSLIDLFDDEERAEEFWIDMASVHRTIATYYLECYLHRWHECDRYGLRHLAVHLWRSGEKDALFDLARTGSFRTAQRSRLLDEPGRSFQVLEIALVHAMEIDDAGVMAEMTLRYAYSSSRLECPLDSLQIRNLKRAWALADLHSPEQMILWHLLLISKSLEVGRVSEALSTVERLQEKPLFHLPEKWRSSASALVVSVAEVSEEAFGVLYKRILPVDSYYLLCRSLSRHAKTDIALNIALSIQANDLRDKALKEIAIAQALRSEITSVLQTVQRIRAEKVKTETLEVAILRLVQDGHLSAALEIMRQAKNSEISIDVLEAIVVHQVQNQDFDGALAIVPQFQDEWWRVGVLSAIHRISGASTTSAVTQLTARDKNEWQFRWEFRRVMEIESQILDRACCLNGESFLSKVLAHRTDSCDTNLAIDGIALRLLPRPLSKENERICKADALSKVMLEQVQRGHGRTVLDRMSAMVIGIAQSPNRSRVQTETLISIAMSQATAGDFREAFKTVSMVGDETEQTRALKSIIDFQIQIGSFDTYDAFCESMRSAMKEIARSNGGNFDIPLRIARKILRKQRPMVLKSIATKQARQGKIEAARKNFAASIEASKRIWAGSSLPNTVAEASMVLDRVRAMASIAIARQSVDDPKVTKATLDMVIELTETIWDKDSLPYTWVTSVAATNQVQALVSAATAYVKVGEYGIASKVFDTAIACATSIPDEHRSEYHQAHALLIVANALLETGRSEIARKTIALALERTMSIWGDYERAMTLCQISILQARSQNHEGAIKSLDMALEIVEGEVNDWATYIWSSSEVLASIAEAQASIGLCHHALHTMDLILDNELRQEHWPLIAEAILEQGNKECLRRLLLSCTHPSTAYKTCGFLARAYPEQADMIANAVVSIL